MRGFRIFLPLPFTRSPVSSILSGMRQRENRFGQFDFILYDDMANTRAETWKKSIGVKLQAWAAEKVHPTIDIKPHRVELVSLFLLVVSFWGISNIHWGRGTVVVLVLHSETFVASNSWKIIWLAKSTAVVCVQISIRMLVLCTLVIPCRCFFFYFTRPARLMVAAMHICTPPKTNK